MIVIDPPNAAGHGRLWSHLASDTSFEELHAVSSRELINRLVGAGLRRRKRR
jgi:hypothetical protein